MEELELSEQCRLGNNQARIFKIKSNYIIKIHNLLCI